MPFKTILLYIRRAAGNIADSKGTWKLIAPCCGIFLACGGIIWSAYIGTYRVLPSILLGFGTIALFYLVAISIETYNYLVCHQTFLNSLKREAEKLKGKLEELETKDNIEDTVAQYHRLLEREYIELWNRSVHYCQDKRIDNAIINLKEMAKAFKDYEQGAIGDVPQKREYTVQELEERRNWKPSRSKYFVPAGWADNGDNTN